MVGSEVLGHGPRRRGTTRRIQLAIPANDAIRQVPTSCHLLSNLADVLLGTANVPGDTPLTQHGPGPERKLNRVLLVRATQPRTMRPVRTQSEPQRIIERPGVDIRFDLPAARAAEGAQSMETVGKPAARTVAESNHRRERRPLAEALRIVLDDLLRDLLAHLGARRSRRCCRSSVTASSATTRAAAPATTSSRWRAAPRFFIDCGPDYEPGSPTRSRCRLGIEKTATTRVGAGIGYALDEATKKGHCGLPVDELRPLAAERLEVDEDLVHTALDLERVVCGRRGNPTSRLSTYSTETLYRRAWSKPNARSKPRIRRAGFSNTSRAEKLALTNAPSVSERSRPQIRRRVEHLDPPRSAPS